MPKFQFYNLNRKYSSHENNFELISYYLSKLQVLHLSTYEELQWLQGNIIVFTI